MWEKISPQKYSTVKYPRDENIYLECMPVIKPVDRNPYLRQVLIKTRLVSVLCSFTDNKVLVWLSTVHEWIILLERK